MTLFPIETTLLELTVCTVCGTVDPRPAGQPMEMCQTCRRTPRIVYPETVASLRELRDDFPLLWSERHNDCLKALEARR